MNLQQIESFVQVAHRLSFTAAAEAMHVTQPTVSYQVSSLEKELGLKLIFRTRSTTAVTDEGSQLLPLCEDILDMSNRLISTADKLRGDKAVVFGMQPAVMAGSSNLLSQIVSLDLNRGDGFGPIPNITIMPLAYGDEKDGLLAGRYDIVILNLDLVGRDPRFKTNVLHTQNEMFVAFSDTHRLRDRDCVSFEDIKDENYLLVRNSSDYYDAIVRLLERKLGPSASQRIVWVDSQDMLIPFIRGGAGIGFYAREPLRTEGTVCIPLDTQVSFKIGLAWVADRENRFIRKAVDIISSIWQKAR